MDIKDLTGLSQPLTKLVEVIGSGMGAIYKPIGIRREAAAQAAATRMLGAAQLEVELNRSRARDVTNSSKKLVLRDTEAEIAERAQTRIEYREVRRQENLEAIADSAASHLPDEVSTTPVDEDWKTRFFNIAEDISNAQMQDLWGKILAGEVTKPGTYSLRTLEAVRNISQREAEIFQKMRHLVIDHGWIMKKRTSGDLAEFGLPYDDILLMREAGLLADKDSLRRQIHVPENRSFVNLSYNGICLLIEPKKIPLDKKLNFEALAVTSVGKELIPLIEPKPNVEYLKAMAQQTKDTQDWYYGVYGSPRESFTKLN